MRRDPDLASDFTPLISVALGAILGFFPAYFLELKRERNRRTTRWDEPLYKTCSEFAAAARKSVAILYRTKGNTELEETLDECHDQMRALTEQLYLLGTPEVQQSARLVQRHLYAMRKMVNGELDPRAAEYPGATPDGRYWTELRRFYIASRIQLRVASAENLAALHEQPQDSITQSDSKP
jgi:hypothetical protein